MKKSDRFVLDKNAPAWWAAHRPKTLPDPGLQRALADYSATLEGGFDRPTLAINARKVALSSVKVAMQKVIKSCLPVVHDPTRTVLQAGLSEVTSEEARLSRLYGDAEKSLVEQGKRLKEAADLLAKMRAEAAVDGKNVVARGHALRALAKELEAKPPTDQREYDALKLKLRKSLREMIEAQEAEKEVIGNLATDFRKAGYDEVKRLRDGVEGLRETLAHDFPDIRDASLAKEFSGNSLESITAGLKALRDELHEVFGSSAANSQLCSELAESWRAFLHADPSSASDEEAPKVVFHATGVKPNTLKIP